MSNTNDSVEVNWNAIEADKNNEITKLFSQLPPACSTILSDKIPLEPNANLPYFSTSIGSEGAPYYQSNLSNGTRVFYVEEYNDLFVVPIWQFKASTTYNINGLGSKFYVFHDFINPHTLQPHINVANSTVLSVDVIPNLNNFTSTSADSCVAQQLIFWQHNCLWHLYPDIEAVSAGSAFTGKLVRWTYDGVKITKAQTINVGLGSRYNAYALSQRLPIAFELLRNGLIWCGGYSGSASGSGDSVPHGWTSGVLIHIKEDVSNDNFTTDIIHLNSSSLVGTEKDYLKRGIECVYLTQIHRWAYILPGYSSGSTTYAAYKNDRVPFMINLSVDSSSISSLDTSLNTQSNWIAIDKPYLAASFSDAGIAVNEVETILNENNETVLILFSQNGHMFWADSLEQLQGTKQWNFTTRFASKYGAPYSIGNRLVICDFNNNTTPLNPQYLGRYSYSNDYPTLDSTKYFIVSWTENGRDYFTKRIQNGLPGHSIYTYTGGDNEYDTLNSRQLVLDKYVVSWVQLPGDQYSSTTFKYGFLVVIDLGKNI